MSTANGELRPFIAVEIKEKKHGLTMWGVKRIVTLDILMVCWGLGTWLGVSGLYVQLPLLVERLPEGWALPSSMALAVQLANVGLLFYALLRRLRPSASDAPYVYGLLAIGTLALLLNAFLYPMTAYIGSDERSIAFLTLTFFAALVGCTSSVLFYPYLRHYRDIYLSTYLAGEGLSGFVPSILALIQGVGGEPECLPSGDNSTLIPHYPPPRFGTTTFFLMLSALSAISLISFLGIDNLKLFESEKTNSDGTTENKVENSVRQEDEVEQSKPVVIEPTKSISLLETRWVVLFTLMTVLNFLSNGVMPSVQSYSCMPYGARAYHLAVTLGGMSNPAVCLACVWLRPVSRRVLTVFLTIALVPIGYILATAILSPTPPLVHQTSGIAIIIISWVLATGLVSYARVWVFGAAREGGAKAMRACGAFTQIGSALGSLLMFLIVNYTDIFVQPETCPVVAM